MLSKPSLFQSSLPAAAMWLHKWNIRWILLEHIYNVSIVFYENTNEKGKGCFHILGIRPSSYLLTLLWMLLYLPGVVKTFDPAVILVARLRRVPYSWLLDHSSISRARSTGKGCESCLVCAFLQGMRWIQWILIRNCQLVLHRWCCVWELFLTLYTTLQGLRKPCHKSELVPKMHPHLVDQP